MLRPEFQKRSAARMLLNRLVANLAVDAKRYRWEELIDGPDKLARLDEYSNAI